MDCDVGAKSIELIAAQVSVSLLQAIPCLLPIRHKGVVHVVMVAYGQEATKLYIDLGTA